MCVDFPPRLQKKGSAIVKNLRKGFYLIALGCDNDTDDHVSY